MSSLKSVDKLVVLVQARMGSSRLPGKISMPLKGEPLLLRMLERVRAAKTPFELVVATTTDKEDDVVSDLAEQAGYQVFRGHPTDLLERHLMAARSFHAKHVVKIPSDCPLIDPEVIDFVLNYYIKNKNEVDFVSNLHPATYPDGNDVEVMSMDVLEVAYKEATKLHEREHTTPFIWDSSPGRFRLANLRWPSGLDYSMSHRFTIDYPEDYAMIKEVYEHLYDTSRQDGLDYPVFGLWDILNLLEKRPDIYELNAQFAGVNWYRNHLDELKSVNAGETRHIVHER